MTDKLVFSWHLDAVAGAQEAQMKAIRGVSSDIAHDLKTPLQRVAVHLEA